MGVGGRRMIRDMAVDGLLAAALGVVVVGGSLGAAAWQGALLGLVPASAWLLVPWAVGTVLRSRRETAARVRQEAARVHRQDARRRADEERLRIAREVHDVVGHGLAAIHMQAEIAMH